jgi:hypothetical protein
MASCKRVNLAGSAMPSMVTVTGRDTFVMVFMLVSWLVP